MKLTKDHRECLLNELDKAQQDAIIQKACLNKETVSDMQQWFEITLFLAQQRVSLIKKSLTWNEIDF